VDFRFTDEKYNKSRGSATKLFSPAAIGPQCGRQDAGIRRGKKDFRSSEAEVPQ
jgi:hypothetical protein